MIHIPPQTVPGGRYDIAQTCALLGIHRNSLRVYTINGAIRSEYHPELARKLYTAEEIQRFCIVNCKRREHAACKVQHNPRGN